MNNLTPFEQDKLDQWKRTVAKLTLEYIEVVKAANRGQVSSQGLRREEFLERIYESTTEALLAAWQDFTDNIY